MEGPPLYHIAIIKSFVEYLTSYLPEIELKPILDYAGISIYQLEDEGHWLTQMQVDRFYEILVITTGDNDIARKSGRYAPFSKAAHNLSQYVVGFITPSAAYTALGKYYPHASKGSVLKTKKVGPNQVQVVVTQNANVTEKPYQCENRLGMFEGIAKLFTNELAEIEHSTCMHIDGETCIYNIRWNSTRSFIWKRIINYLYLFSPIIALVLYFITPRNFSVIAILSFISAVLALSLYQTQLEKNELSSTFKKHGKTASNLLDEINARYNNAMLIQEIGHAASNILDIDKLLKLTMDTVWKRLDFDRGLIMLANKGKTRLIYRAGFGYSPGEEALLNSTEFHLDNPNSKGPFILSFKQQKPLLINDIKDIEKDLSRRSHEFIRKLNVKSFICVPIVYEGRSKGILAVDNYHSERPLNQSDINLFLGIAPQLGISINNARLYELILDREQQFRALSENAPDIIYTINARGRFVYVNPAWERILGHRREDVEGKWFVDFVKQEDIINFIHAFKRIRDSKERIVDFYGTILHKDGSERLFHMSGAPNIDSEGKVTGAVGTFKDITELKKSELELREANQLLLQEIQERKQAESKKSELERQLIQAQKMEAIGTLAGGIAHDFNNLLMAIQGYASLMMLKTDPGNYSYEKLKNIEHYVLRGSDLTRQLLGFARGGKYEIRPTHINDLITKSARMFGRTKKEIALTTRLEPKLWTVEVDQGQIEQVLLNLFVNASQAMPGGGRIDIETQNRSLDESEAQNTYYKAGRYVKISVKDSGIGMDEKTRQRIFEPFFTTKEMGRGTGLGLASAYGIIKSHGGFIDVESEIGRGSNFIIHLPISTKAPRTEHTEPDKKLHEGNETILLVDDESSMIDVGVEMLSKLHYKVISANSGKEAVELFQQKKDEIHLTILDMIMPDMNGSETFHILNQIQPGLKVLVSSGYSLSEEAARISKLGANSFIQKPFDIYHISSKVREVLDKSISTDVVSGAGHC